MAFAFVLLNCHFPFDTRILEKISLMPYVKDVHRTEGRYDLIVKINAETEEKLRDLISTGINKLPGVDATIHLIVAREYE